MGHVSAKLELPYPADLVFRVATRIPDLPRWMPEVVDAELLDDALATGSRIRLRLGPATGGAEITGTVDELRPPELLAISGHGGPLGVKVRVALLATGPSTTLVKLEVDLATPPFLGFIAKEAERRIQAELPASMERFRVLVEDERDWGQPT
jgi:uncharacterized protein YndB with AHSA1/START domain